MTRRRFKQMTTKSVEQTIVDQMFSAFSAQNLDGAVATVSEDTVWIHHGTQKLPSLRFEGKSGVREFFNTNFTTMRAEYFDILKTIQQDDTVIVFGREKFFIEGREGYAAQKWVQVYTVKNGLITRMEEFATSVEDQDYIVVK